MNGMEYLYHENNNALTVIGVRDLNGDPVEDLSLKVTYYDSDDLPVIGLIDVPFTYIGNLTYRAIIQGDAIPELGTRLRRYIYAEAPHADEISFDASDVFVRARIR